MKRKTAGMLFLLLLAAVLTVGSAVSEGGANAESPETAADLTFSAAALSGEPSFVDWTQDGIAMQLIARKDETGAVRLAFNTCQSCGGSPYAWFESLGNGALQCQNCGLIFPLDSVGATGAAGCNPVTLTEFSVDGDTVTVPQSVLAGNAKRFANWKKFAP